MNRLNISRWSVITKLMAMLLLILLLITVALAANTISFNRIKESILTKMDHDIRQIILNTSLLKELSEVFAGAHYIVHSFTEDETHFNIYKERIIKKLVETIKIVKEQGVNLQFPLQDYTQSLRRLFAKCSEVNAILSFINSLVRSIENDLSRLDEILLEKELYAFDRQALESDSFQQLSIILPAYHEIFYEITLRFIEVKNAILNEDSFSINSEKKFMVLLDEFTAGLHTTTTSAWSDINPIFWRLMKSASSLEMQYSIFFAAIREFQNTEVSFQQAQAAVVREITLFGNSISEQNKNITLTTSNTITTVIRTSIILSSLIILLLISIGFFALRLVRPIKRLNVAVQKVGSGNLSFNVDIDSQDEIGQLAVSFNQMTEDLRKNTVSKRYMENIIDSMNDSLIVLNPEGTIQLVNQATCRLLGYRADDLIGQSFELILEMEDSNPLDSINRLIEQNSYEKTEIIYLTEDSSQVPVLFSSSIMRDDEDSAQGIVCVAIDITDRKKMEMALAAEKERLNITLRSIGDGVICTDTDANITLINKVAEDLTGWSHEDAVGKPLFEVFNIINEVTGEPCENPAQKVIEKGLIVGLANNTVLVSKNGNEFIIADSAAPIMDHENNTIGVVLVFRDVTETRKMEQELLKVQKLESMGILAGGIAHDFNNYLTVIIGNLSLAKMQTDSGDRVIARLDEMEKASIQATNLTQQLLTFAKGGEPIKKLVSIPPILKNSAKFSLRGSNIRCEFDISDDLPNVEIDEGQIGQVIHNLIINAGQAMPNGGSLSISAESISLPAKNNFSIAAGLYLKITIADNGPGISPDIISKIFDPYFTTKHKGNGLGLTAAYSIIDKHNGRLSVESVIGKGATFYLLLPASLKTISETVDHGIDIKKGQGKVLVMDDEESLRDVISQMLNTLGYGAYLAKDGKDAVKMYKAAIETGDPFDAVILDLTIPGGMGGVETIRELKTLDPHVRAIVSSGYSTGAIMANFKKYGFSGVILKPYRIQDLSESLSLLLRKSVK